MRLTLSTALILGSLLGLPSAQAQAPAAPAAPAPAVAAATAVPLGQPLEERNLLAHRAAYRLTLAPSRNQGNIASATGGMIYELVDACDSWASRQRFTLTLTDREGTQIETASDYSTVESKDGRRLPAAPRRIGDRDIDGAHVHRGGIEGEISLQQREGAR